MLSPRRAAFLVHVATIAADQAQAHLKVLLNKKVNMEQHLAVLRGRIMLSRGEAGDALAAGDGEKWTLLLSQVAVMESSAHWIHRKLAELEVPLRDAKEAMTDAQIKLEQTRFLEEDAIHCVKAKEVVQEQKDTDEWFLIKQRHARK